MIIHAVVSAILALLLVTTFDMGATGTRYYVYFIEVPAGIIENPVMYFFIFTAMFAGLAPIVWLIVCFFLVLIFGNWTREDFFIRPLCFEQKLGAVAMILSCATFFTSGIILDINYANLDMHYVPVIASCYLFGMVSIILGVLSILKGKKIKIVSGRAIIGCIVGLMIFALGITNTIFLLQ